MRLRSLSRTKIWYCRIQVCCNALSLHRQYIHATATLVYCSGKGGRLHSLKSHRTSALFCGQNTSKAMQDLMKPYVGRHLIWISHRYHLGDRSAYLFSPSSWTLFKTLNEKFPEVPRHLYTPDKLYAKHNHGKM